MPGVNPIKKLYLAKNIDELQKQAKMPSASDPSKLVKVAQKLLSSAKENEINGDQEKAYVLFYKYFELYKAVRKSVEYKKDKIYYDSMVNPKDVKEVIEHLESLNILLKERYDEEEKAKEAKETALKTIRNNLRNDFPTPKQMNNGKAHNDGVLLLSKYYFPTKYTSLRVKNFKALSSTVVWKEKQHDYHFFFMPKFFGSMFTSIVIEITFGG